MYMSDGEIATSYKQAKNQSAQIHVLAELNGTGDAAMRAKLRSLGFDVKEPKARQRKGGSVRPSIDTDRLRELFLEKKSDEEIAAELGTSPYHVSQVRRSHGWFWPKGGNRSGTRRKRKPPEPKLVIPPAPPVPEGTQVTPGAGITVAVLAEMLRVARKVYPQAAVRVNGAPITALHVSVVADPALDANNVWVSLKTQ